MRNFLFIFLFLLIPWTLSSQSRYYMWLDSEANFERLSSTDSIDYYLQKISDAGFTDVVVDMKNIMGEVLYDSEIAPYMKEWHGVERDEDFDMLGTILALCPKYGLGCYASMNVFCGGHNFYDRGIIYTTHPQWQSIVYYKGKLHPISEMKWNYNGMLNPVNEEVQRYELDIIKEFVSKYPEIKGIILDRVRFNDLDADFSDISKEAFERYTGVKVRNYPKDVEKKYRKEWLEWRAMVIRDFTERARNEVKSVAPDMTFGYYTGAWYDSYYYVGANWASPEYDPSKDYDWASENYYKTGYAPLLDILMSGLYFSTTAEIRKNAAEAHRVTCGDVPIIGSIYTEQYQGDAELFRQAMIEASATCPEGVMLFDMSHICTRGWWNILKTTMNDIKIK